MAPLIGRHSATVRFAVVVGLVVALTIPLLLVTGVVADREHYYREALSSVARSWGGAQHVAGPMVVIPIAVADGTRAGSVVPDPIVVMPEHFDVEVSNRHLVRRRGIFDAPVLDADIVATGAFAPFDVEGLKSRFGALRTEQATMAVDISDGRGIRVAELEWNGAALPLAAGAGVDFAGEGVHGFLPVATVAAGGSFALSLSLRGTQRLSVAPIGDRSAVSMVSTWPHPSFDGRFLPDRHEVTEHGFSASWTVQGLARGYPTPVSGPARPSMRSTPIAWASAYSSR